MNDSEVHVRRFRGRFTVPGEGSRDVEVLLGKGGIEILGLPGRDGSPQRPPHRSGANRLVWPYGALASEVPLSKHAIEAVLTYSYQPGARLFVSDRDFARALTTRATQLTVSAQNWRRARPWLWAGAAVAGVIAIVYAGGLSPARTIAGMLPDGLKSRIGQQVIDQMSEGRKVCENAPGRAAMDKLVARLSPGNSGDEFKVTIVDWDLLNAFAAPGRRIVVTRELIAKSDGPDELAGVLAHEMGHGIALHPESSIVRSIGLAASVELVLGGGGLLTGLGLSLTQLAYSREAEREADEEGIALLREAGISPKGLSRFFRRVAVLEGEGSGGSGISKYDMLRSHPQTAERLKRVEAVAPYPATPALSAAEWAALQRVCAR